MQFFFIFNFLIFNLPLRDCILPALTSFLLLSNLAEVVKWHKIPIIVLPSFYVCFIIFETIIKPPGHYLGSLEAVVARVLMLALNWVVAAWIILDARAVERSKRKLGLIMEDRRG